MKDVWCLNDVSDPVKWREHHKSGKSFFFPVTTSNAMRYNSRNSQIFERGKGGHEKFLGR